MCEDIIICSFEIPEALILSDRLRMKMFVHEGFTYAYVTKFGSPYGGTIMNIAFAKITNKYQRLNLMVTNSIL